MTFTADQIRQGLNLPNTDAGREVAGLLVEAGDDPAGYISDREFGVASDGRINSNNFERILGRARSPQEQVQILRALTTPGTVRGQQFSVSHVPGGEQYIRARLRQAELAANPASARPAGPAMPNPGGNWALDTTQWSMRNEAAARFSMIAAPATASAGLLLGTGAFAVATMTTAPVWVPIAMGVAAVALVGAGAVMMWRSIF